MARDKFARQSLGGATYRLVKESRVLLVGAGGIGCELLKNIVLTGFGEIHIIDLDTIDLSNLNRQFLFRHEHIKKSKALVAKEVAQKFNPSVKLIAHHANIKDKQFNLEWFSQFSLVFNALDNMEARRYVNKMCLAVDIPLIESGTTGFRGQVQVIKRGQTACYECNPKSTPVSYPVCTIRSTPSQSIHCIVWAKSYLLPELFGISEDEPTEMDNSEDSDNAAEIGKLKEEAQALKKIRESMGRDDFAQQVFDKVFSTDIERLAKMEDVWKTKKPPEPLVYNTMQQESAPIDTSISTDDQRVWSALENFVVFKDSLDRLSKRQAEQQTTASKVGLPPPTIAFDKDDDDTMDFVTAAGNLRAVIFGISPKSKFDIKQMAGNIIPAIATTNAMVAGLCVMQASKVLKGDYTRAKWLWVSNGSLQTEHSEKPNPDCAVCSVAMARLRVDFAHATLGELVHDILQGRLQYGDEIAVMNDAGIIYDPDLEDNLAKKLSDLGIGEADFIIVRDEEDDNPRIDLQLAIQAQKSEEEGKAITLTEADGQPLQIPRKVKKAAPPDGVEDGPTDGMAITNGSTSTTQASAKRKRELDDEGADSSATPAKKIQGDAVKKSEQETIVIDEDDGTLLIADDD